MNYWLFFAKKDWFRSNQSSFCFRVVGPSGGFKSTGSRNDCIVRVFRIRATFNGGPSFGENQASEFFV